MRFAMKKQGKLQRAFELGTGTGMERRLIQSGSIEPLETGGYRLHSLETGDGQGQVAAKGDFFKVEIQKERNYPYPIERSWFLQNHKHLFGNLYRQRSLPKAIWSQGDPPCQAVEALLQSERLQIHPESRTQYYSACLWGTVLYAAADAVLVFHRISDNPAETDFAFLDSAVFERDYALCDRDGHFTA